MSVKQPLLDNAARQMFIIWLNNHAPKVSRSLAELAIDRIVRTLTVTNKEHKHLVALLLSYLE